MTALQAGWKLLRALWCVLGGFFIVLWRFPRLAEPQRHQLVQAWSQRMLAALGVDLERCGAPAPGPMLQVANHVSWLDILVLHAGGHCRFVAKADLRRWPLIGRMASGAGTLYIERESRRDAMRVVHHMADSLRSGEVLAVFPEGTTSDGLGLLPFHANLIQAAISAGAPVQPVALSYLDARTRQATQRPRYVDDQTLLGSVWRTVSGPGILAVVSYGEPQTSGDRDRRTWAGELREAVARMKRDAGR